MKYFIILKFLLFFLIFPGHVSAKTLSFPLAIQEQTQWCWAAVSRSVLSYYGTNVQQCRIAEYTRTKATWHNFGNVDCCIDPSKGCNYWNYNWGYSGSIEDILKNWNVQTNNLSRHLSQQEITNEINANRPFIIRWKWLLTGGGHFVAGYGINNSMVSYMDPWHNEGHKTALYSWVVSGGNYTWTHTQTMKQAPAVLPGAPTLSSPANGATVAGTSVTFSWNTPSGSPSRYHLQISTSSTFSSFFYNNDNRTGNSVTLSLFPNNGTRYYWRVRAYNSAGWGAWSGSRSFINGLALPDKPTLISPAHNAKLTKQTETFRWNSAARATMYWLAVANNLSASGSEMLFWGNVGNVTQYTLTLPRDGRKYYWMVTGGNNADWGPWSYYRTLTAPPPGNPGVMMLLLGD